MSAGAFWWVFAAGWAAGQLWHHRHQVGRWLEGFLNGVLTDPPAAEPPRERGRSHVRLIEGSGPEEAA